MMGKPFKILIAAAVMAFVGSSVPVQAAHINGTIEFSGGAVLNAPLGSATYFSSIGSPSTPITVNTGGETGSYLPLNVGGQVAVFTPFTFGASGTTGSLTVNPFWTLTTSGPVTYSFEITSVDYNSQSGPPFPGPFLNLEGSGIAMITGFDNTPGTWTINDTGNGLTVTFGSSVIVPDGGMTVLLLGAALTALGLIKRRMA